MSEEAKWYFSCIMVVAIVVAACATAVEFVGAKTLKREAVLLGYATDGPDGFKWKERK